MPTARSLAVLALLLPLTPAAAFAAAATASHNVNIRSGPATTYSVLGQLQQGDSVDVRQCEGSFCEISYAGGTGWVSASFLTRSYVAPQQQVASAPSSRQPLAVGQPPAVEAFPPAYDSQSSDGSLTVGPPAEVPSPTASADMSEDDAADAVAGATGAPPRPRVDVPDTPYDRDDSSGDGGYANADPYDDGPPDDSFTLPDRGDGWPGPRFGWGGPGRFHGYGRFRDRDPFAGATAEEACFLRLDGSPAFCLGDGESIRVPARWQQQPLRLHNPGHLTVAVCSLAAWRDCATYVGDGPILMGNRGLATIRVSGGGY